MINISKLILSFLFVTCLLILPTLVAAKPQPVPGVMKMFNNFNELEESFRDGEWGEANETVTKIESDYKKLVGELKGVVDGKTLQKFGFLIGSFKKQLASKDKEAVEKPFINLQTMFIDIMDHYNYENPPVLIIIARYVGEAEEALEKGEVDDAGEEMEEISGFKTRAVNAFTEKGLSKAEIDEFFEMVEQTEELAEKNDKEGVEAQLEKLEKIVAPYMHDDD